MPELSDHRRLQQAHELARWQEPSQITLALAMSAVATLFIAGIAAVFIYAKDASPVRTAAHKRSSAEVSEPAPRTSAPAQPAAREPETTGSSSADQGRRAPARDPREDAQMERD